MSVEEKFMRATHYIADGDVQLSDNQRTAFYGLQKQAIDGIQSQHNRIVLIICL
jgi:hypothetical protein